MQTQRLVYLVELDRQGSMRGVADALGTSTSTVSQQLAALAAETGAQLTETVGRGVRLTPAGTRLAAHARGILAAVDAATLDLDPEAEPAGTVRACGYVGAIRKLLMPIIAQLSDTHPNLSIVVQESEPAEAQALLLAGEVDLALTYDYNLAPDPTDPAFDVVPVGRAPWGLGVPSQLALGGGTTAIFMAFRDADWIGNSRNGADEVVLRTLASMAGFTPRMRHQSDSLELVEDLIVAGLGVGLLPMDRTPVAGVTVLPLDNPNVEFRSYVLTRKGRNGWPPLALVGSMLATATRSGPAIP
ncbi:MAG: LysR family transcriptional regulator [Acidobacteria bacterium]|nr:LysR family transcriptional regulator [Acidobacteriota bacterium]